MIRQPLSLILAVVLVFALLVSYGAGASASAAEEKVAEESAAEPESVDFARDVQPIFERGCKPCHFPGGRMYARAPFDKPETIERIGKGLITRFKDKESQAVLTAFLAQRSAAEPKAAEDAS